VALGVPRNPQIVANRDPRFFDLGLCGPDRTDLVSHADYANPALQAKLQAIASSLVHAGSSAVDATHAAYGAIYRQLIQQAQTLAYLDTLFVLACITSLMVPAVLLTRKAGGQAQMGH